MHTSEYTPLKNGGLTLLIDTDIGPDCDDAGALAVAAALAKRYRVPVGAVVSCTSSPYGAPCAEAICRFCGLEVGVFAENKQPGLLTRARNMRYNREIAERFGEKRPTRKRLPPTAAPLPHCRTAARWWLESVLSPRLRS